MAGLPKSGLAAQLQNYYTRKGNKIVFSNGMTLNQLAIVMWEKLDFSEMDASVLSKVLKSERCFNLRQAEIFCRILGLNMMETEKIYSTIISDRINNYRIYEEILAVKNFNRQYEALASEVNKIQLTRECGMLQLAWNWSVSVESQIQRMLKETNVHERNLILTLLASLLFEKQELVNLIFKTEKVLSISKKIYAKTFSIAKETHNKVLAIKSKYNLADAFYVSEKYSKSLRVFKEISAMNGESFLDFRQMCSCAAFLNDEINFCKYAKEIYRKLDMYPEHEQGVIWCGLSRAYNAIGDYKSAAKGLNKCWDIYYSLKKNNDRRAIQRKLQIIRVELELSGSIQNGIPYYKKLASEGLMLADELGFTRYGDSIKLFLSKNSN